MASKLAIREVGKKIHPIIVEFTVDETSRFKASFDSGIQKV